MWQRVISTGLRGPGRRCSLTAYRGRMCARQWRQQRPLLLRATLVGRRAMATASTTTTVLSEYPLAQRVWEMERMGRALPAEVVTEAVDDCLSAIADPNADSASVAALLTRTMLTAARAGVSLQDRQLQRVLRQWAATEDAEAMEQLLHETDGTLPEVLAALLRVHAAHHDYAAATRVVRHALYKRWELNLGAVRTAHHCLRRHYGRPSGTADEDERNRAELVDVVVKMLTVPMSLGREVAPEEVERAVHSLTRWADNDKGLQTAIFLFQNRAEHRPHTLQASRTLRPIAHAAARRLSKQSRARDLLQAVTALVDVALLHDVSVDEDTWWVIHKAVLPLVGDGSTDADGAPANLLEAGAAHLLRSHVQDPFFRLCEDDFVPKFWQACGKDLDEELRWRLLADSGAFSVLSGTLIEHYIRYAIPAPRPRSALRLLEFLTDSCSRESVPTIPANAWLAAAKEIFSAPDRGPSDPALGNALCALMARQPPPPPQQQPAFNRMTHVRALRNLGFTAGFSTDRITEAIAAVSSARIKQALPMLATASASATSFLLDKTATSKASETDVVGAVTDVAEGCGHANRDSTEGDERGGGLVGLLGGEYPLFASYDDKEAAIVEMLEWQTQEGTEQGVAPATARSMRTALRDAVECGMQLQRLAPAIVEQMFELGVPIRMRDLADAVAGLAVNGAYSCAVELFHLVVSTSVSRPALLGEDYLTEPMMRELFRYAPHPRGWRAAQLMRWIVQQRPATSVPIPIWRLAFRTALDDVTDTRGARELLLMLREIKNNVLMVEMESHVLDAEHRAEGARQLERPEVRRPLVARAIEDMEHHRDLLELPSPSVENPFSIEAQVADMGTSSHPRARTNHITS